MNLIQVPERQVQEEQELHKDIISCKIFLYLDNNPKSDYNKLKSDFGLFALRDKNTYITKLRIQKGKSDVYGRDDFQGFPKGCKQYL